MTELAQAAYALERHKAENEAFLLAARFVARHGHYKGEPITQREQDLMRLAIRSHAQPGIVRDWVEYAEAEDAKHD